jgi:hypothetical protein
MHTAYWSENVKVKSSLERYWCRWEDNIKMNFREKGWEGLIGFIWLWIGTIGGLL